MKKCLLGIDNATQSMKIALYDEEFDLVAVYTAEQLYLPNPCGVI